MPNLPGYVQRVLDPTLDEYLKTYGAVCIEGPKWSGKTWLGTRHAASVISLADPAGNFRERERTQLDLEYALDGKKPRLVDEWQEVPELWDAVRYKVDQLPQLGQYILTGSSTPVYKGVRHSGVGRIATIHMHTLSMFESGDSSGEVSLRQLCDGVLTSKRGRDITLRELADRLVCGGWPAALHIPLHKERLPYDYLDAVLASDIRTLTGRQRNRNRLEAFLRSLARHESTTASIAAMRKDISGADGWEMDAETVKSYLDIFQRLYLIEDQLPFAPGLRSSVRVKQAVKRHLADPSLACALLNADAEMLMNDLETMGFIFESLCVHDLRIYGEAFGAHIYHYQDYRGNEFDAVVQLPGGRWCAFEVKLGARQVDAAARNLLRIARFMEDASPGKGPSVLCVLCGLAPAPYRREDGVFVVPINVLGP